MPEFPVWELVVYNGNDTGGKGGFAADTQGEHHHEEYYSEKLRKQREFGDRVWIRDESESSTTTHHCRDIFRAEFVHQMAQNTQDCAASQ